MRRLSTPSELRAASGDDPLVIHLLPHVVAAAPILAGDGAVLFVYDYWDGAGVQLVGEPQECARLLDSAAGSLPTRYAAVPEDSVPLLAGPFDDPTAWCFRWTGTRPLAPPSAAANWLEAADDDAVAALLDSSFPDASARPGNRHVRRWAGIREPTGALVAVAADCTESDVGFMASVATDVRRRRSGLGLAMITWMTHALLDEHPVAALWQYSSNTAATALYQRLGYSDDHRYISGVLPQLA